MSGKFRQGQMASRVRAVQIRLIPGGGGRCDGGPGPGGLSISWGPGK